MGRGRHNPSSAARPPAAAGPVRRDENPFMIPEDGARRNIKAVRREWADIDVTTLHDG
jgi:hypothetical protein